ncbi:hypothetical protein BRD06_11235 [Halobacteriales archaeon QS_9_67_15]|nr:MAG: hypothetical protein BRD06_11235 [Halobacteriales archaeon QS_9_67_15]
MTGWPLDIEGTEYHPVPESWVEHGDDHGTGEPRVYAVSVTHLGRKELSIRYRHGPTPKTIRIRMRGTENSTGDGIVPSLLANDYGSWPRSVVPTPNVKPQDVARDEETERLREIWGSRVDEIPEPEEKAIADGGRAAEALFDIDQYHLSAFNGGRYDD